MVRRADGARAEVPAEVASPSRRTLVARTLDRASLLRGVAALTADDPGLADIVARHGPPPLWSRPPGFATLARIVLEQQVSLSAAATMFARIDRALGGLTPDRVAGAGFDGLRALGLTRQKARYLSELAARVESGALPLDSLGRMSDERAEATLRSSPGIGPWTSGIYLLMALRRPDVWPPGDLALVRAVAALEGTTGRMSNDDVARVAERWRPWRAVAARILWHGYLGDRGLVAPA